MQKTALAEIAKATWDPRQHSSPLQQAVETRISRKSPDTPLPREARWRIAKATAIAVAVAIAIAIALAIPIAIPIALAIAILDKWP